MHFPALVKYHQIPLNAHKLFDVKMHLLPLGACRPTPPCAHITSCFGRWRGNRQGCDGGGRDRGRWMGSTDLRLLVFRKCTYKNTRQLRGIPSWVSPDSSEIAAALSLVARRSACPRMCATGTKGSIAPREREITPSRELMSVRSSAIPHNTQAYQTMSNKTSLSLSLSLSHTHTHTHTHSFSVCVGRGRSRVSHVRS